ncbi:hypothetical protein EVAR_14280_1 [Eumeta japonica]|uniref:Uncharacterized protein n=1 Tax=Eumeta variegata TaxID=151549 RepID=A0A4C1UMB5_EUMVA|nr:hypothetical protein EVAR_14280_1 [Eumeta japonica]
MSKILVVAESEEKLMKVSQAIVIVSPYVNLNFKRLGKDLDSGTFFFIIHVVQLFDSSRKIKMIHNQGQS